jgi:plasmid maintenance system antidote protein VapI
MDFSLIVRDQMKCKGLKITELATQTGLSYAYCNDLLRGRRRWNEDTINNVCGVLGITIQFQATGTDS